MFLEIVSTTGEVSLFTLLQSVHGEFLVFSPVMWYTKPGFAAN